MKERYIVIIEKITEAIAHEVCLTRMVKDFPTIPTSEQMNQCLDAYKQIEAIK